MEHLKEDSRKNVQALWRRYQKEQNEKKHLAALYEYEEKYKKSGFCAIAGTDEAGRGPLAGPVIAAAVILPFGCELLGLNDSKKLSAKKRDALFDEIKAKAISIGAYSVSAATIDKINIYEAAKLAMYKALDALGKKADFVLTDAMPLEHLGIGYEAIIKGDAKSASIAAASIIAKVTRDRLMEEYDKKYPQYGFASHKGYGTAAHIEALKKYGPCPIHRRTFEPIKSLFAK